jgi:hypothetical protein
MGCVFRRCEGSIPARCNGHSGDVNKVGAQVRWSYNQCPIPSTLIKVVPDSYSAFLRFRFCHCFVSSSPDVIPFFRSCPFSWKNVAPGSPQSYDSRLGRPTTSPGFVVLRSHFTLPRRRRSPPGLGSPKLCLLRMFPPCARSSSSSESIFAGGLPRTDG